MDSIVWKIVVIIGIVAAIFGIAALFLKGYIKVKTTLLWILGLAGATALVILLNTYWSSITSHLNLSWIPATTWWIILGVIAAAGIVYSLYKRKIVSYLPSFKALGRALSLIAGVGYIYHVINVHDKLGAAVFKAYFFSVANIAIGMSIVGAILISWLWSDGTRKIPVRKILAVIIGCFIAFMLTDFFFPGFFESLPELWYEGKILPLLFVFGVPVLVAILLFLCLFSGTRKGAATALGFMIVIWIVLKMFDPSRQALATATPARPDGMATQVISSTSMTEIPWPGKVYRARDIQPDPTGKRPTLLVWEQAGYPKEGDPCRRLGPSDHLLGEGDNTPLWVMVDTEDSVEIPVTMLYWRKNPL